MMAIGYFILVLGVLVLVHEWGHFIMARRAGIRVETFSIGFGPRIFAFRRGETEFKICLLPLGGFVKMLGEDPEDEHARDPGAFTSTSVAARVGVVTAGPLMNFLLAAVLMPLVFFIGRNEPEYLSQPPVIRQLRQDAAAAAAGLQPGDRLLVVDGTTVTSWEGVLDAMLLWSGDTVRIAVERNGARREYAVRIAADAPRMGRLGVEPPLFYGNDPVIDQVLPGSPAAAAGVEPGDRIVRVGATPVADWQAMSDAVNALGAREVPVEVQRNGMLVRLTIVPQMNDELHRYVIGVQKDPARATVPMVLRRYGPVDAIVRGEREVVRLSHLTLAFLKRLVLAPRAHYQSLGGPIQIAQASVAAARSGVAPLLYFAAFLSLQLGMLNLLPIPVLDGGHVLFLAIERLRRRPLPARVRIAAQQVGMVLLLSLLLVVTINDLDHLVGIRRWLGRWL